LPDFRFIDWYRRMNALRDLDQEEVLAAAEVALATSTGETVHIQDAQVLSDERRRNLILRGNAVGPGGQSRPIIIKITRLSSYDPGAENALDNSGLLKEWAATAFLSTQRPARRHSAMLLAGDAVRGLLVFEDLGAGLGSLVEPLLHGSADEAERALLAYASALGRLHVDTAGHIVEYERTLRAVLPAIRRTVPRPRAKIEENASKVRERLGGPPAPDGLMQIAQRLDEPGIWFGLVHGDPCPDNALLQAGHVRLIDYEFAEPGHVLLDAAYWRFGFRACWCAGRIPDAVATQADAAYRAEFSTGLGTAVNDAMFQTEMAIVAAAWLLRSLVWHLDTALKEDAILGIASIRSRLLWYLQATIAMTEAADVLPDFRSLARAWLADLRDRWPQTQSLSLYPAFAGGAD
jgi:Phosphotransferase enzyme family